MALNYIWIGFILIAVVVAAATTIFTGDNEILYSVMNSMFVNAKTGFTISIGLAGILTLWLGIMKIGEKGGVIQFLAKITSPFFNKIFPEIPKNHPVLGSMVMNFSANMLGIDNAATPIGLKAIQQLQELNPKKDTASKAMIMFLVLNTAGFTLIPITVITYQAQFGAANPTDIVLPTIIASTFSSIFALVCVAISQKINLFQRTIVLTLGTIISILGLMLWGISSMSPEQVSVYSKLFSSVVILGIVSSFVLAGIIKKINIYDAFIEGAKDGFNVAVRIIPFLIAVLVAVGMFRTSGAMDFMLIGAEKFFALLGINTDFVPALPTAIMKPMSGSGARGLMLEAMEHYGVESFVSKICCILQGTTDTTFYILALYFGSVGIKKTGNALTFGLLADLASIFAAIFLAYMFFY